MKLILKRTSLFTIGAVASLTAVAGMGNIDLVPFTDNFSIVGNVGTEVKLDPTALPVVTSGPIKTREINSNDFNIYQTSYSNTQDGTVSFTVISSTHPNDRCKFTIEDGAYMMDPVVVSHSCNGGLIYRNFDHNIGSYQYTLTFLRL